MDGYRVKLKNKRVFGSPCDDGSTYFKFTNLIDGEGVVTKIKLSDEALGAMISIWGEIQKASNNNV